MNLYFLFRYSKLFRVIWGILLLGPSLLFRILVLFKRLFTTPVAVSIPVIGIGNLTVGGTGKTPFTIKLTKYLKDSGYLPVVFTTGYKSGEYDGKIISDESEEIINSVQGIEVIPGKNRLENLLKRQEKGNFDIAVLDDAFQQWKIKKNLDILLIDSTFPFGNGLTLPAGILREPVSSLKRADIVILTHSNDVPDESIEKIIQRINKVNRDTHVFKSRHIISSFSDPENKDVPVKNLTGKKAIILSGIANPFSFNNSLNDC